MSTVLVFSELVMPQNEYQQLYFPNRVKVGLKYGKNPQGFENLEGLRDNNYICHVLYVTEHFRLSKFFKNIAVFSLWLAGLVIMSHLFIPHDHHSDSSVFSKENDCHAENMKHHSKSPAFPLHCHALNDLTFEKTTTVFFANNNIPTCDLFFHSFVESVISNPASSCVNFKDFHIPLIETDFLRLSPFRAPPARV